jgi:uncharacterized protein (TIGR03083 family)
MEKNEYLAHFRTDAAALAAAAQLGLTASVPSCPGWSVADLVVHVGGVHRAQAAMVAERAREPGGIKREMFDSVPGLLPWLESSVLMGGTSDLDAVPPGIVRWFEEGAALLAEVLASADPDEPVWSWSANRTAGHYLRMMPIETAVHRWDAQLAHGVTRPIDRSLAADGINHTFEVMLPSRRAFRNAPDGRGETYRFRQTDGDGSWLVRFEGEPIVSSGGDDDADVTVTGSASDLFLLLWHRLDPGDLTVEGDTSLIPRYFELVPPV